MICCTMPTKKPDSILDYQFDWRKWLQPGETILTAIVTVPTDLILNPSPHITSIEFNVVTFWLAGGTIGSQDRIICEITTDQGRTSESSFMLSISEDL